MQVDDIIINGTKYILNVEKKDGTIKMTLNENINIYALEIGNTNIRHITNDRLTVDEFMEYILDIGKSPCINIEWIIKEDDIVMILKHEYIGEPESETKYELKLEKIGIKNDAHKRCVIL